MKYWERVCEKQETKAYTEEHFEAAAYHLMSAQVLYQSNKQQVRDYRLIKTYIDEFSRLFSAFGMTIDVDTVNGYVVALPRENSMFRNTRLTIEETLFISILRLVYDLRISAGETENGRASIDITELMQIYSTETGRELTNKPGEIKQLVATAKRFGMARTIQPEDGSDETFDIEILPGIVRLLSENRARKIAADYLELSSRRRAEAEFFALPVASESSNDEAEDDETDPTADETREVIE